jgi:hypothetical protein
MKLIQLLKEIKLGEIDEISTISTPSKYNITNNPVTDNVYDINFKLNQYQVNITISLNPLTSLKYLDIILNTNYEDQYEEWFHSDEAWGDSDGDAFLSHLPENIKKIGEISFEVNENWTTRKQRGEEGSDTKGYLEILSKVGGIVSKFISKYNPNIFIFNKPEKFIPDNITIKRNNVYKYFINKYIPNNYTLNEKNNIIYIQKS